MKIDYLTPEATILTELGRRLAHIRKQQGFSQTRLAEEAGIGVATLRRIEAGQDSQMETWIKVMKAIRMTAAVNAFLPENFNSPMAEALSDTKKRKQKRRTTSNAVIPPRTWGDLKS